MEKKDEVEGGEDAPDAVEPEVELVVELVADEAEPDVPRGTPEAEEPEEPEEPEVSPVDRFTGSARMAELLAIAEEEGEFPLTDQDLASLPRPAQMAIANLLLRQKAVQGEVVAGANTLDAKETALARREADLKKREAEVVKFASSPKVLDFLKTLAPTGKQPDESVDPSAAAVWAAKQSVAEVLQGFLGSITEWEIGQNEAAAAAHAEAEKQAQVKEVAVFIQAHREDFDMPDFKEDIIDFMRAGVPIARAYKLVMLERGSKESKEAEEVATKAARTRIRGASPLRTLPPTPVGLESLELQEWWDAHPGTMLRDMDALRRRRA